MKKILLIVLLLITINKINSQNLLSNPSFDGTYGTTAEYAGCAPSYFYNPNWGVSPASNVVFSKNIDSNYYRTNPTSQASQKVVVTNIKGYCYFAQPFKVKGKRVLKASIWVKPILATAGEQKIELMIRSRRQYNPSVTAKEVTLKGSDWQQIEIEGTTGCLVNDNNVYIYDFFINFKTPTSTPQTLYLDDASVTDVTNNQNIQNNLIENSSFEGTYGTTAEYTGCAPSYYYNPNWNATPASSVTFSKDTINSLSGRACQKVVVNSIVGYCYFAQGFNIAKNQKLKASIWIKPSADANLDFALRSAQTYNPDIARIHCNTSGSTSGNSLTLIPNKWQKVEIYGDTGTLVDNTTGKNLYLFIDLKSAGTIYLEDAVVTNVTDDVTNVTDEKLTNIENALPNLLINPDFEDDFTNEGVASPFFYNPNWPIPPPPAPAPPIENLTAAVTFSKYNCTPQKGLSCQKIVVTSKPTFCYYEQAINVKGSRIFKACAWVKSPDNVEIDFTLRSRLDYQPPISSARTLKVGTEWQKIEIIGGMGSLVGENQDYILDFFINFRGTGTLYIDNASVVDVTDIIKNKSISNSTQAQAIPKSFFGMHINKLGVHNDWPDLGFGTLRLWDTGTKWSDIEPVNNAWVWNNTGSDQGRLKLYIDKRNNVGDTSCNIMYTLGMPAQWASTDTVSFAGAYRSVKKLSDWEDYVTQVATKYDGQIKYWEIWNEIGVFFDNGTNGNDINKLAKSAYTILKNINPDNVVLTPNFTTSTSASDFLFKCNGDYYFDVFSFHMYTSKKPENDIGVFYGYRNLLNNLDLINKPIWNTEGANTSGFDNTNGYDIERVGAVSRAYIIQWLYDVKNFNWYFWEPYNDGTDFGNWALHGTTLSSSINGLYTNLTNTPAGNAYKRVAKWLVGKRMVAKKNDANNNWIITIYNPVTLKNEFILWNANNTNSTYTIPSAWGSGAIPKYDLFNDLSSNVSGPITLNAAPILLTPSINYTPVTRQSNNEFIKKDDLDKYLIYPNPANNYLIIQKKELDNIETAKLYDLNGRLILDNIILNSETNKINIENILKGIYILEIQNEKQARYNYKVIIENR